MLKRIFSEEKGQSMAIFPILLIVLIGVAGLSIDGGRLYIAKSQLQKAVDAGVLAGADAMIDDFKTSKSFTYTIATDKAKTIAEDNHNDEDDSVSDKITYVPISKYDASEKVNYVQVTGTEEVSLLLMPVLEVLPGIDLDNITNVEAKARVNIGKISKAGKGVIPIGLPVAHFIEKLNKNEKDFKLLYEPGEGKKGNFNFLDFSSIMPDGKLYGQVCEVTSIDNFNCDNSGSKDGKEKGKDKDDKNPGTKTVGEFIASGFPNDISVGQEISTRTGIPVSSENILPSIKAKEGKIVYIPIISETGPGKSDIVVLGFAAFKIDHVSDDGKIIDASFLESKVPGDVGYVPVDYLPTFSQLVL